MSDLIERDMRPAANMCRTILAKQIEEGRLTHDESANMVATVLMYVARRLGD